ncbi:MAG: SLC13 family permease [Eggerthellales bacterium]|nr:SLC13 family permease [Eggerthellales bacterium]
MRRVVVAMAGVAAGVAVGACLSAADVGLSFQGCACLGVLVWAVVWWVASVLPEYATGLLMIAALLVIAGVPTEVGLSAFSEPTWWLLVSAFGLGAGMKVSGLMRRMALAILRLFPRTFKAQAAGFLTVGTVLGPLIPSLSAKTAILAPVAMSVGEAMGYARQGKRMQGLFLAMLAGVRNIGPAVISASILGYALVGLLPADVVARFDLLHWFVAALPWFLVATLLSYVALVRLYDAPDSEQAGPSAPRDDAAAVLDQRLGSMSVDEKRMCVIVLVTIALWVAEPLHGVPTHVVGLVALVATVACGILGKNGLRTQVNWESLIFMGTVFGLGSVFSHAGVNDWIVTVCGPLFQRMAENPYVFVLGVGVSTMVLRFVIVSEMAYLNIVMVFMVPLAQSQGIDPWVVGMAMYCMISPFFAPYQNPVYLTGYAAVDGQMITHGDAARFSGVYMGICLIALAVSVPYWQWMGLFG